MGKFKLFTLPLNAEIRRLNNLRRAVVGVLVFLTHLVPYPSHSNSHLSSLIL